MPAVDLTTTVAIAGGMAAIMYLLFHMMLRVRESKYDLEKKRIELDVLRASLERKVYEANDRLVASPPRWKEVNHLLLEAARRIADGELSATGSSQVRQSKFLRSVGLTSDDYNARPSLVFVLTPFHERHSEAYEVIMRVCNRVGLECQRGDEEFIEGGVLKHIVQKIAEAGIIIANIDGRNPNVFYELGLAHAMDKEVILVSSSKEDIPFDFRNQRILIYRSVSELEAMLLTALAQMRNKKG